MDACATSTPCRSVAERATEIDDFSVQVRAGDTRATLEEVETPHYATTKSGDDRGFRLGFSAKRFTPASDFVVSYARQRADDAEVSAYVPSWGEFKGSGLDGAARGAEGEGYFALRLRADLPAGMSLPHVRRDRAIVVDASHSQSKETLAGEAKLAAGLVASLDPDERFVVLACDSACVTFPDSGLASPTERSVDELGKWLRRARRAARPTSRARSSTRLAASSRMLPARSSTSATGRRRPVSFPRTGSPRGSVDAPDQGRFYASSAPAERSTRSSSARWPRRSARAYEPVLTGETIEQRVAELSLSLRSPVIRDARFELPASFGDGLPADPSQHSSRRASGPRREARRERARRRHAARRFRRSPLHPDARRPLDAGGRASEPARPAALVPRAHHRSRKSTDSATSKQVVDLSKRYHVMSRYTSLLVLENDQMFADFGIKRTTPPPAGPVADALALGSSGSTDLGEPLERPGRRPGREQGERRGTRQARVAGTRRADGIRYRQGGGAGVPRGRRDRRRRCEARQGRRTGRRRAPRSLVGRPGPGHASAGECAARSIGGNERNRHRTVDGTGAVDRRRRWTRRRRLGSGFGRSA